NELPIKAEKECVKYVLLKAKDGKYAFLGDGLYKANGKLKILVKGGCLYRHSATLRIKSGKSVDSYQEDSFNTKGELVFWAQTTDAVPNGKYSLQKEHTFEVTAGNISGDTGCHTGGTEFWFKQRD